MRKLNISVPTKYTDRNGDTKTKWVTIGGLVVADDGKIFGNIDAIPVDKNWDGTINCFDREERQQQGQQQGGGYQAPATNYENRQGQQQTQQQYQQNQNNHQQGQN